MKMLYSNRSKSDQAFINKVCHDIISPSLEDKPDKKDSDIFCGIFIEGRDREINTLEDLASLYSFKKFSKYNYPIYCFIQSNINFLGGDYHWLKENRINLIQINPINSLDEYTNFCIRELYNKLPNNIKWGVTLQPDAMLLKEGWEDIVMQNDWVYIGSPWGHIPAIEIFNYDDCKWDDFFRPVRIGNGGFSIRKIDFCRAASRYYGDCKLREKFAPNNKVPPEDLFYSVVANNLTIGVPTVEQANEFCCDPLTPEKYNSNNKPFGFHYFKNE